VFIGVECCWAALVLDGVTALRLPVAGLAQLMPLRVLRLAGRAGDTARSGANGQPSATLSLLRTLRAGLPRTA